LRLLSSLPLGKERADPDDWTFGGELLLEESESVLDLGLELELDHEESSEADILLENEAES